MEEKQNLIDKMQKIVGYVPTGTRDLLSVLAHPDLIDLSTRYLEAAKKEIDPCEGYLRIFGQSLACMGELNHDNDHYVHMEDDYTQKPVTIKWKRDEHPR